MREFEYELETLNLQILIVTFEDEDVVKKYVHNTDPPWPLLIDDNRKLYTAYKMEHGKWWDIYGPASWWIYLKLLLKGRKLSFGLADFEQLGGDVLIDPEGVIRLHYVGKGPAHRPAVESITSIVQSSR